MWAIKGKGVWERFTDEARRAIYFSMVEAKRFGATRVDSEHLLLGIVYEQNRATAILEGLGVTSEGVKEAVDRRLPKRPRASPEELLLAPRGKQSIDGAIYDAKTHNREYVGTENLLFGLVDQTRSAGARVLGKLGMREENLREAITASWDSVSLARNAQMIGALGLLGPAPFTLVSEVLTIAALDDELLGALGIEREALHAAFEEVTRASFEHIDPDPGPSLAEVLAAADAERQNLGHRRIETGHIVLAVTALDTWAKAILERCSLDADKVRETVEGLYSEDAGP